MTIALATQMVQAGRSLEASPGNKIKTKTNKVKK